MTPLRRWRERGQETAEFAIILPVLFLLLMGVFDMGRIVFYYDVIYNAAREGARYGIVHSNDDKVEADIEADIETVVRDWAVALDPQVLTVDSTIDRSAGTVRVTVTYKFTPVTPLLIGQFFDSGTVEITGQATMRIEG